MFAAENSLMHRIPIEGLPDRSRTFPIQYWEFFQSRFCFSACSVL